MSESIHCWNRWRDRRSPGVSSGGGTPNDMPWRDKDEDYLHWARRAMRYAHAKHYPGNRFKRSMSK